MGCNLLTCFVITFLGCACMILWYLFGINLSLPFTVLLMVLFMLVAVILECACNSTSDDLIFGFLDLLLSFVDCDCFRCLYGLLLMGTMFICLLEVFPVYGS